MNRRGLKLMALALMSGALTHTIGTEAPPEQREPILPPHTPEQIKAQAKRERKAKADEIAEVSGLSLAEVYEGNRRLHRRRKVVEQKKRRRP